MAAPAGAHLNDVEYDAFLANDHTLDDPEIFRVERGGRVRLRLINGAAATNFWIDLGGLEGRLIAVDGMAVEPVSGRRFEFAIAQRLDIVLDLPKNEGAWPIFAIREGDRVRTGFILATSAGAVERTGGEADEAAAAVGLALEGKLRAVQPLAGRPADREHTVTITEAPGYVWMLNGKRSGEAAPLSVSEGERVESTFRDQTTMAHPMHLHGHHFQVVATNGKRFPGAVRDTVLGPSQGSEPAPSSETTATSAAFPLEAKPRTTTPEPIFVPVFSATSRNIEASMPSTLWEMTRIPLISRAVSARLPSCEFADFRLSVSNSPSRWRC